MIEWLRTGFLLLRIWTRAVGLPLALWGCAWVIVRKALPHQEALATAIKPRSRILEVQVPGHPSCFYARWPASDLHILWTIVRQEEYAPVRGYVNSAGAILFLDLGANIGAASRYVLDTYPNSRAVAVEPAADNVRICRMNLAPYGDRARVIQAAVWERNTRLVFEPETTQIGTEAGIRLREPIAGEESAPSMQGIDIPTLLEECSLSPATQLIVKIDVEGSEEAIFSGTNLAWLDEVSCIAIEFHDSVRRNCSRNFFAAVEGRLLEPARKIGDTVFVGLSRSRNFVTSAS